MRCQSFELLHLRPLVRQAASRVASSPYHAALLARTTWLVAHARDETHRVALAQRRVQEHTHNLHAGAAEEVPVHIANLSAP